MTMTKTEMEKKIRMQEEEIIRLENAIDAIEYENDKKMEEMLELLESYESDEDPTIIYEREVRSIKRIRMGSELG